MKQQVLQHGKPVPAAAAILMVILMPAAEAAERVRWEALQRRYGGDVTCKKADPSFCRHGIVEFRSITVITRDGKKRHTRRLLIDTNGLRLAGGQKQLIAVPRSEVTRIEIRQLWRYIHNIVQPGAVPFAAARWTCGFPDEPKECNPLAMTMAAALVSPVWAYTAVSAPFFLAADVVGFFLPTTVYEIEGGGAPGAG